jgi:hypothetical protein
MDTSLIVNDCQPMKGYIIPTGKKAGHNPGIMTDPLTRRSYGDILCTFVQRETTPR